ncbi:hypothetical protein EG328_004817 [Venturia inaequalis]|uniref:MFS general substrate transporter n=1 Tax=Venturia inaequalis TaxID=5025 RepID=A0A8H3UMD8_VENIN|nr:hypothetical protein EG328_004817 [Venturia inaequalis]
MAVIFTSINFIAVLLFVPETQYNRDISKSLGSETSAGSVQTSDPNLASSSELVKVEKSPGGKEAEVASQTDAHPALQIPKKTWLQEMSLWNELPKDTNLWEMFIRPLPLIVYPAVMFSFLTYAVSLAWVVAINILNSFILQAPPYNWKPSINGLINIPALLGNLLGSVTGGWLVDKYSDWRARKNNGVFKPESRLVLLIIPALIVPAGCILFGYGVAETMHWTTLFFGNGMVSVGLTAVPIIGMTYVSDAYLPLAPDALLLVNGLKNIVAFGFLHGVSDWVASAGYINAFGTQAGVYVAILALAIPLFFFGERVRHTTSLWKIVLRN